MSLPSFSKSDTAKNKIDGSKAICLPDSILRKAAQDILKYEECKAIMAHNDDNLNILNEEIGFKDKIIIEKDLQLGKKDDIIGTWKKKFTLCEAETAQVSKDFLQFKKKDRNKMIAAGGIILGILAAWGATAK